MSLKRCSEPGCNMAAISGMTRCQKHVHEEALNARIESLLSLNEALVQLLADVHANSYCLEAGESIVCSGKRIALVNKAGEDVPGRVALLGNDLLSRISAALAG